MKEFISNSGNKMIRINNFNWDVISNEHNENVLHLDVGIPNVDEDYYNFLYYIDDELLSIDGLLFECPIDRIHTYVIDAINGTGLDIHFNYTHDPDEDIKEWTLKFN